MNHPVDPRVSTPFVTSSQRMNVNGVVSASYPESVSTRPVSSSVINAHE